MATTPSTDLEWLLLRKHNSFLRPNKFIGTHFSCEPGNLRSIHSPSSSGLANSKVVHIAPDEKKGVVLRSRKADAPQRSVGKAFTTRKIHGGGRKVAREVASAVGKQDYRPDLRTDSIARASAILQSQKTPRPTPARKTRGKQTAPSSKRRASKTSKKNYASAAADPVDDDDDDIPDLV